jgi:hypothetical protein
MIEATRRKLDEARFFYGHLFNERRKTFRHDPLAFRYYFSAFIQAARDVLRRAHYEEKEKWEAWEPKWRAKRSKEEQKLLDLTNELRIDEVHRGGANPTVVLEEVALHELLSANFGDRQHPAYGVQLFNLSAMPGVSPPKTTRPAHYFEDKDGKEEVTTLCQRYLDFLEKVLNDYCADNQPASPDAGRR